MTRVKKLSAPEQIEYTWRNLMGFCEIFIAEYSKQYIKDNTLHAETAVCVQLKCIRSKVMFKNIYYKVWVWLGKNISSLRSGFFVFR